MKTTSVFAAVAAIVVVATSAGVSAQAQSDPQKAPAPAAPAAAPAAPASAPAAAPAAAKPAASAPAATGAPGAAEPPLTKEQSDAIEAVIVDKCTVCHGAENIVSQHLTRTEWNEVLINMGATESMTKDQMALAARYLVANFGPQPKP